MNDDLSLDLLQTLDQLSNGDKEIVELKALLAMKPGGASAIKRTLELIEKFEEMHKFGGKDNWFTGEYSIETLPKHREFFKATNKYNEVMFLAGNRVGKTIAGAYTTTCWATGEYPDWWEGRVFEKPVNLWVVGKDARSTRDTLQKELLGPVGEWGTGMIPARNIGKSFALQGTPQAIDIVKIKSAFGGWSEIGFKNYQQDIGSFMGTARDAVWGDEEMPILIYNECNIRTATTNGVMLLTFTPLDGLTPLVVNFCKRATYLVGSKPIVAMDQEEGMEQGEQTVGASTTKAVIQAGWDDVPWLDEKTKARLLEDTPPYLREARSKGLPAQSSGNVYQTPLDNVLVEPFDIPTNWPRMYALDVGWNTTAAVWGALDPATDTLYFYSEHYMGKELPAIHGYSIRSRGSWIPGVIDPAAHGRSPTDGKKLIVIYKDMDLNLREAKNEVEAGLVTLAQRFEIGKAKIFKTCINIQKEYQLYRRDRNGKVIKENDHAMDCCRYIVNNLKYMASKQEEHFNKESTYVPTQYNC